MHQFLLTKQNWTSSWQTNNLGIPQHQNNEAFHPQGPFETHVSPHAYVGQPPSLTPFDFNQSEVELFRHQTELRHIVLNDSTNKLQTLWKIYLILLIPGKLAIHK